VPDDGQAFPWGLTPGGTPEQATPVRPVAAVSPVAPVSPVDQGHFVAVPDPRALPGQATPTSGHVSLAGMDVAVASFSPEHPAPLRSERPAALSPEQPLAAAPVPPEQPDAPAPDHSNALDNLFGEQRFLEYQSGRDGESPFERPVVESAGAPTDLVAQSSGPRAPQPSEPLPSAPRTRLLSGPRAPLPKLQRTLIWAIAGLAAVLVLGGLFLLGRTIAPAFAAAPVIEPAPSTAPSASPEAVPEILGPVVPGTYDWDDLLGTECVDPWGSAWDQNFTVVDCGEPHAAQLVYRATFDESAIAAYPGFDVLQSRMNLLCASSKNIDYSAAKKYDDIQLSASFAAIESDWVDGQHDYFCFVSRSSGEQLTTDVAKPDRPAPVVVEPEP